MSERIFVLQLKAEDGRKRKQKEKVVKRKLACWCEV
jgi:hypothetical protein